VFALRLVDKLILLGKRTSVFREITENSVCFPAVYAREILRQKKKCISYMSRLYTGNS